MQGKWRGASPSHVFDAPHLKINYDPEREFASGFLAALTKDGAARKYPYEALFRAETWHVAFTLGDPDNANPFSNRDRDPARFRELRGVPRFHRKDIAHEVKLKLTRFRDAILAEEAALRALKAQAKFLALGASGSEYWLHGVTLIRVAPSSFRDYLAALEMTDLGQENIRKYLV